MVLFGLLNWAALALTGWLFGQAQGWMGTPGLARTNWHREGKQVTIEYEGEADYAAVLEHYAKGFAAQGYAQGVQSATPSAETHEYAQGGERITLKIAQLPKGAVSARIETPLQ